LISTTKSLPVPGGFSIPARKHLCHSIRIEHRNDPEPTWLARRKSHTFDRSANELKIEAFAVILISGFG
jgi:hypothetical protein